MLTFDNTEIAFSGKTKGELKWAHQLFKMLGSNTFIAFGKWATNLSLKLHLPVFGIIKKTIFKQFCGGEAIEECSATITKLDNYKIGTILDYSVEAKENTSESSFEESCQELLKVISHSKNNEAIPFAVFKISGICSLEFLENYSKTKEKTIEYTNAFERVDRLCKAAFEANTPIFIDAEESWVQDAIDEMVEDMMVKYNQEKPVVYNTLQMYRWDRLDYLKKAHQVAKEKNYWLGVKIVRGAYMEKERERAKDMGYKSPIQADKNSSDKDYNLALEYCVENHQEIAICAGTHNEESSMFLTQLLDKYGIEKNNPNFYFAQLLGMSDHISFNLSNNGYKVAKYVPYGPVKEVIPYLIRRAEENTSVAGQTGRELSLITKEIKRRKLS